MNIKIAAKIRLLQNAVFLHPAEHEFNFFFKQSIAFIDFFFFLENTKSHNMFHLLNIASQVATYQELHSQLLATENTAGFDRLGLLSFPLLVI